MLSMDLHKSYIFDIGLFGVFVLWVLPAHQAPIDEMVIVKHQVLTLTGRAMLGCLGMIAKCKLCRWHLYLQTVIAKQIAKSI